MAERSFFNRFVVPVCIVMIPLAISCILYFNSARIDNDTAHQLVAMTFGLAMMMGTVFGATVIYPLAFFRGARPAERIIAALMPAIAFEIFEVYVVSGVFPLTESLFYVLNPVAVTMVLLAFGLMGLCELVGRWIIKRRDEKIHVLTPAPIAAMAVTLGGIYVALIWGNGAHFFYAYIYIYQFLFKS